MKNKIKFIVIALICIFSFSTLLSFNFNYDNNYSVSAVEINEMEGSGSADDPWIVTAALYTTMVAEINDGYVDYYQVVEDIIIPSGGNYTDYIIKENWAFIDFDFHIVQGIPYIAEINYGGIYNLIRSEKNIYDDVYFKTETELNSTYIYQRCYDVVYYDLTKPDGTSYSDKEAMALAIIWSKKYILDADKGQESYPYKLFGSVACVNIGEIQYCGAENIYVSLDNEKDNSRTYLSAMGGLVGLNYGIINNSYCYNSRLESLCKGLFNPIGGIAGIGVGTFSSISNCITANNKYTNNDSNGFFSFWSEAYNSKLLGGIFGLSATTPNTFSYYRNQKHVGSYYMGDTQYRGYLFYFTNPIKVENCLTDFIPQDVDTVIKNSGQGEDFDSTYSSTNVLYGQYANSTNKYISSAKLVTDSYIGNYYPAPTFTNEYVYENDWWYPDEVQPNDILSEYITNCYNTVDINNSLRLADEEYASFNDDLITTPIELVDIFDIRQNSNNISWGFFRSSGVIDSSDKNWVLPENRSIFNGYPYFKGTRVILNSYYIDNRSSNEEVKTTTWLSSYTTRTTSSGTSRQIWTVSDELDNGKQTITRTDSNSQKYNYKLWGYVIDTFFKKVPAYSDQLTSNVLLVDKYNATISNYIIIFYDTGQAETPGYFESVFGTSHTLYPVYVRYTEYNVTFKYKTVESLENISTKMPNLSIRGENGTIAYGDSVTYKTNSLSYNFSLVGTNILEEDYFIFWKVYKESVGQSNLLKTNGHFI